MPKGKKAETYYCHDRSCKGFSGFEVTWFGGDRYDPPWPERDTCPYCGDLMHDDPLIELEPEDPDGDRPQD